MLVRRRSRMVMWEQNRNKKLTRSRYTHITQFILPYKHTYKKTSSFCAGGQPVFFFVYFFFFPGPRIFTYILWLHFMWPYIHIWIEHFLWKNIFASENLFACIMVHNQKLSERKKKSAVQPPHGLQLCTFIVVI